MSFNNNIPLIFFKTEAERQVMETDGTLMDSIPLNSILYNLTLKKAFYCYFKEGVTAHRVWKDIGT